MSWLRGTDGLTPWQRRRAARRHRKSFKMTPEQYEALRLWIKSLEDK